MDALGEIVSISQIQNNANFDAFCVGLIVKTVEQNKKKNKHANMDALIKIVQAMTREKLNANIYA